MSALSHANAAAAQATGRWFAVAVRSRRSFFCSVTAAVGVAMTMVVAVAMGVGAAATAMAVNMIVAVVTVIAAMTVVAAVGKAEDIVFVARLIDHIIN